MKRRPLLAMFGVVALTLAAGPSTGPSDPNRLFPDDRRVALPRISVEVVGHGPAVVLVPGLNCSRLVWRATVEQLRDRYTLHVVQVAGFAGEPAGANAHGPVLDPVVDAIDGYIRTAKLAPVPVIGHSLGGTMALRLAQEYPADVSKVMLVDAIPFYGVLIGGPTATPDGLRAAAADLRDQMATTRRADEARAAAVAVLGRMVIAPADVDRAVNWSLTTDRAVGGQAAYDDVLLDMRPGLAAMTVPVTLLYPYDSTAPFPLAAWDAFYQGQYAAVPHHAAQRIDAARHFIMYDQPAKFAAAVDAFLGK